MNKNNLSNNLYELRRKAELSQEEFAEKLGVSRQAVSKWERGEAYPDTENLIVISEMFSVSIDELLKSDNICYTAPNTEEKSEENASNDDDFDDDEEKNSCTIVVNSKKKRSFASVMYAIPYPVVVAIAFITLGIFCNAWYWAWTLFLTVPIYYPLISAIHRRRLTTFPFPVFVTFIYCLFGMLFGIWHPLWLIFLTVPIYYPVASAIDEWIRG